MRVWSNQSLYNITEICGFVTFETLDHTDDDNFLPQVLIKIFNHNISQTDTIFQPFMTTFDQDIQSQFNHNFLMIFNLNSQSQFWKVQSQFWKD